MILVDTSVWVDHLRKHDAGLAGLLEVAAVLTHPFVIGELACGNLADRRSVLGLLERLPQATTAEADEVLRFIDERRLFGKGIGLIDAHLLASTALTAGAALWTRDRALSAVALEQGCAYRL